MTLAMIVRMMVTVVVLVAMAIAVAVAIAIVIVLVIVMRIVILVRRRTIVMIFPNNINGNTVTPRIIYNRG